MPAQIFPTSACLELASTWHLLKSEHWLAIHSLSIRVSLIFGESKQVCFVWKSSWKYVIKDHTQYLYQRKKWVERDDKFKWNATPRERSSELLVGNICSALFKIKETLLQNVKKVFSMWTSDFIVSLLHRIHQNN